MKISEKVENVVAARLRGKGYEEVRVLEDGRVLVIVDANAVDKSGRHAYSQEDARLFRRAWGEEWPRVPSTAPVFGCKFFSRGC